MAAGAHINAGGMRINDWKGGACFLILFEDYSDEIASGNVWMNKIFLFGILKGITSQFNKCLCSEQRPYTFQPRFGEGLLSTIKLMSLSLKQ